MNNVNGRIDFYGMKATRALQKYVERQIEKWIQREQTLCYLPKTGSFTVQIERSNEFPYIECAVEVKLGAHEWRSLDGGRTIQDALKSALRHLNKTQVVHFSPAPMLQFEQNFVA